jgi:hypothetical protein
MFAWIIVSGPVINSQTTADLFASQQTQFSHRSAHSNNNLSPMSDSSQTPSTHRALASSVYTIFDTGVSFDNIASSILQVVVIVSLNGWGDLMVSVSLFSHHVKSELIFGVTLIIRIAMVVPDFKAFARKESLGQMHGRIVEE